MRDHPSRAAEVDIGRLFGQGAGRGWSGARGRGRAASVAFRGSGRSAGTGLSRSNINTPCLTDHEMPVGRPLGVSA
jgi:hypothetical protein